MIFPPPPEETPKGPEPAFGRKSFVCPHCTAHAQQRWDTWQSPAGGHKGLSKAHCEVCSRYTVWLIDRAPKVMLWPPSRSGILPHPEMPEATRELYDEAREVAVASPRAAVALLRVAADVLLREVIPDADDKSFSALIGQAVKQGLSPSVQIALDVLRTHGNDAVHPVQLVVDEADASEKVTALCRQLNLVVEQLVSIPRQQSEAFAALPESVRKQIEKRDRS